MNLSQTHNIAVHPAYMAYTPPTASPLVYDSAHHSLRFPNRSELLCTEEDIRHQADLYIPEVFSGAIGSEHAFLAAEVARSYVDFNRDLSSVHPDHVRGELTRITPAENDYYASKGLGICRTVLSHSRQSTKLTEEAPTEDDILDRWNSLSLPYHAQLSDMIDRATEVNGASCHITAHNLFAAGTKEREDLPDYTFFLGTKDGYTAEPEIVDTIADALERAGFLVARDVIFKGQKLIEHADPKNGRNAIQIEVCREKMFDPKTYKPHEGFREVHSALTQMSEDLGAFMRFRTQKSLPMSKRAPDPDLVSSFPAPAVLSR